jgi:hypothetical protein
VAEPFNSSAPDCIEHGLEAGLPYSAEIAAPFQKCFEEGGGFFTFGPGRSWAGAAGQPVPEGGSIGQVIHNATAGIYVLTTIGVAVMILAFIAFVWTEHRKLMDRAAKLRAAGGSGVP